jgi:hypothetical protein
MTGRGGTRKRATGGDTLKENEVDGLIYFDRGAGQKI